MNRLESTKAINTLKLKIYAHKNGAMKTIAFRGLLIKTEAHLNAFGVELFPTHISKTI